MIQIKVSVHQFMQYTIMRNNLGLEQSY